MFRYSLLICVSVVLYGTTASPYKSRGKNSAVQDTRYDDLNEKMLLGLKEVEPLENLDLTEADIDPSMFIWKAVKRSNKQKYNEPEEDKDQLYHSFEAQHTAGKEQSDAGPMPQYGQARLYEEAEKDLDDLYHNTQGLVYHADPQELTKEMFEPEKPQGKLLYLSPEEDKDELYHGKYAAQEFEPVMLGPLNEARRVYTEPEEDLDALYHK